MKDAAETVSWSPAMQQFLSDTPELGPILCAAGAVGEWPRAHSQLRVTPPTSIFRNI